MGVNIQASPDEIKTAYKKTALKLHPDKDREPGAEDRFKV
jgi:DnaJ-class molecular chaperone